MDRPRRRFLNLTAAAASVLASPRIALAQSYPARAARLVVGFPPGGPNDILGRIAASWLTERLGQPFEVDNKPGRSGNIATEMVVRAPADGYTILLVGPANTISGALYPNLGFNFLRDIAPVCAITREPLVMVVHPSVPARTAAEFIAYAQTNMLKMASTGNGSSPHVTGELFKQMTGLKLNVAHYAGGGPALKALIAGEAQMMFEPISASIEPVQSGKLRALAVTTATRSPALPDVPPLALTVMGFEASALTGIGAPKDTPRDIIVALNRAMNAGFANSALKAKLAGTGGAPLPGAPEDFGKLLAAETEKWARVVKTAGVKAE
jgi:tripartite-type tricarboxylate transporter receptor subunit TctC